MRSAREPEAPVAVDLVGMSVRDVHDVLDVLSGAGVRGWIGGGWGVDALAGRQTRPHRDFDLAIDVDDADAAVGALLEFGYMIETDWRPVRVELCGSGKRWVDLHPVGFDDAGNGIQPGLDGTVFCYPVGCFTTGRVAGRSVRCLSVEQQLEFHRGYEPREIDLADVRLLRELGVDRT